MASSLNRVQIIGNLGKDPEVRTTQAGGKIVNLTVACSERWKDRQSGEMKERTEWVKVVIFNPNLAEVAEKYLRKGSRAFLEGSLQTRKWQGQDGKDNYSTEVVLSQFNGTLLMLDGKRDGDAAPVARQAAPVSRQAGGGEDLGDEIPFGKCWQ